MKFFLSPGLSGAIFANYSGAGQTVLFSVKVVFCAGKGYTGKEQQAVEGRHIFLITEAAFVKLFF